MKTSTAGRWRRRHSGRESRRGGKRTRSWAGARRMGGRATATATAAAMATATATVTATRTE
jgi:hypothetical protein